MGACFDLPEQQTGCQRLHRALSPRWMRTTLPIHIRSKSTHQAMAAAGVEPLGPLALQQRWWPVVRLPCYRQVLAARPYLAGSLLKRYPAEMNLAGWLGAAGRHLLQENQQVCVLAQLAHLGALKPSSPRYGKLSMMPVCVRTAQLPLLGPELLWSLPTRSTAPMNLSAWYNRAR